MNALEKLTFESVTVRAVSIPMKRPIVAKVGTYTEWPFILIDVKTKEGVVGHSYLEPYLKKAVRYIGPAIEDMGEAFKGRQLAPLELYRDVIGTLHLVGRQGVSVIVAAGLDMAIWDALAKAAGLPLAALLGGSAGRMRTYNTNGLWLLPLDKLANEARELVEEGNFSAIKIRLGRPKLADDLKALELVREAVGNDIQLMCDFNQGQTLQEAIWRCHALDDQGLYWFEEPVVFDNYAQSAQLARELKTPVQIGENIYGPRSFFDAVQAQAADLYMPDLMRIGGVTGWMRAAAIAGAAGHPMSSHLYPEVSAHLLRATETADWLEWRDWGNPIIAQPFEVVDGHAIVPDRPGNGIEWNETMVAKLAY
ncbi:MAG TPA: enolase C-terminal domain-like protein [Burkholderiales bacterium]|nr:enolase C-terminal domain-like protein [Burkholderiales bacterium]